MNAIQANFLNYMPEPLNATKNVSTAIPNFLGNDADDEKSPRGMDFDEVNQVEVYLPKQYNIQMDQF